MSTLHLLPMTQRDVELALEGYPELLSDVEISPDSAFWLGSVAASDSRGLEAFLTLAREHRFPEMEQYAAMVEDMVYGMLVRRESPRAGMRVLVIEVNRALFDKAACLYTDVVEDVQVVPARSRGRTDS